MLKYAAFSLSMFFMNFVQACPMCGGSNTSKTDSYIVYILGGFILFTYIPYLVIFKLIKKNQHLNKLPENAN